MTGKFTSFVILGAMRTGSNFLEASLSDLDGVTTHGEVFNPRFIGRQNCRKLFGIDLAARDADPLALLSLIRAKSGDLTGFRFFRGHDPRILEAVLGDPACAKIVLSRNPVESFVSLKIALETDQWMLTDVSRRRTAQVEFNEDEFATFLASTAEFYTSIRRALRLSGQVPFEIGYDELSDVEVLNGLAAWLGVAARLEAPSARLKRQNAPDIAARLTNPEVLAPALERLGQQTLLPSQPAEPERNAAIHSYVAAPKAPLMFLPVPGGPVPQVEAWLAALDGGDLTDLRTGFGFRTLREWRASNPGHRSFTVVRHPLERAHAVFCARILMPGPECFGKIRAALRRDHGVVLPDGAPGADYDADAHRAGLISFLRFVKRNLAERTPIRIDPSWASQEAVLRGFVRRQLPDMVIREEQLETGLAHVAAQFGLDAPGLPPRQEPETPHALADIRNDEVEAAARAAYGGDYEAFGYGDWRP